MIALVGPLVLQGPTLCPCYSPPAYSDCICLCPSNLQCSNKNVSSFFFICSLSSLAKWQSVYWQWFNFLGYSPFPFASLAVSQFWNILMKAGFLATVWQLRFSWANKEQVTVPGITAVRILFFHGQITMPFIQQTLDLITYILIIGHLAGNCLSTPI